MLSFSIWKILFWIFPRVSLLSFHPQNHTSMKTLDNLAYALTLVAVMTFTACSVEEEIPETSEEVLCYPSVITIDPGTDNTKAIYSFESGRMRMSWEDGDQVYCAPAAVSGIGCMYTVPEDGAATNTFVASRQIIYSTVNHFYYYPGGEVHNDPSFLAFSYAGQVQKKSAPTDHIKRFHSIRKCVVFDDYSSDYDMSYVSLSGAEQSGCLKFDLSGETFVNPTRIMLEVLSGSSVVGNVLYDRNYLPEAYYDDDSGESLEWPSPCSSLSLELEGYDTETHLEAYMMHTCKDMVLYAGDKLRVTVFGDKSFRADVGIASQTAIKGGYFSTLKVDSGWTSVEGDFTEYEWDGDVVTLQNPDKGLDIVFMGDGFIKEDFDNGTYDSIMRGMYEEFFSVEPYKSSKDLFNVFYVKTPSPQRLEATNTGANGAEDSGNITKFSVSFKPNSTSVSGNDNLAVEYARKAFSYDSEYRAQNALVIVVANQPCHAGTCYLTMFYGTDYGYGRSVAYVTLGSSLEDRYGCLRHEAGGHGFGKLGDEYSGVNSFNEANWMNLADCHSIGGYRNVDKYVTENFNSVFHQSFDLTADSDVLWSDLMNTRNGYEREDVESLGFYEGAFTFNYGFCRPTEDGRKSIMNYNSGNFNAISRRAILYRMEVLSGQMSPGSFGTPAELEHFLEWDAQHFLPSLASSPEKSIAEPLEHISPLDPVLPYAPPVIRFCEFKEGENPLNNR